MLKIVVTSWQNEIIIDALRLPIGDEEALLQKLMVDTKLSYDILDAYRRSWRFNHTQGAIAAIAKAVDVEKSTNGAKLFIPAEFVNTGKPTPPAPPTKPIPQQIIVTNNHPTNNVLPLLEGEGIVAAIIRHYNLGMSNEQIIGAGFNKSTVYRQVSEYKKRVRAEKEAAAK